MLGVAERLLFLLEGRDDGSANRGSRGESNVVSEYRYFTLTLSYHTYENECEGKQLFRPHMDPELAIDSKLDRVSIAQRVFFVLGKATGM
jgi:hypothetical protein